MARVEHDKVAKITAENVSAQPMPVIRVETQGGVRVGVIEDDSVVKFLKARDHFVESELDELSDIFGKAADACRRLGQAMESLGPIDEEDG